MVAHPDGTQTVEGVALTGFAVDGVEQPPAPDSVSVTATATPNVQNSGCEVSSGDEGNVIAFEPVRLVLSQGVMQTQYYFHRRLYRSARQLQGTMTTQDNVCSTGYSTPAAPNQNYVAKVDKSGGATALANTQPKGLGVEHGLHEDDADGGTVNVAYQVPAGPGSLTVSGTISFAGGGKNRWGGGFRAGAGKSNQFTSNEIWAEWQKTCGFLTCVGSSSTKGTAFEHLWEYPDISGNVTVMVDAYAQVSVYCGTKNPGCQGGSKLLENQL